MIVKLIKSVLYLVTAGTLAMGVFQLAVDLAGAKEWNYHRYLPIELEEVKEIEEEGEFDRSWIAETILVDKDIYFA